MSEGMNNGLHTSSTVLSSLPVSADQAVWDGKSLLCLSVQRLNPSPICFFDFALRVVRGSAAFIC